MSIVAKYQVKLNNVITVGSSKGGYAALYYALKYGFGHAIAGGPQVKLGDFYTIKARILRLQNI